MTDAAPVEEAVEEVENGDADSNGMYFEKSHNWVETAFFFR